MIETSQGDTGQVDACNRGQHEQQTRGAIEEEGPEEQAQAEEEHIRTQDQA